MKENDFESRDSDIAKWQNDVLCTDFQLCKHTFSKVLTAISNSELRKRLEIEEKWTQLKEQ